MFFILLIVSVNSYLIVNETKKQYPILTTEYGFVPYGRNISGILTVHPDLCSPLQDSGVILVQYSIQCTLEEQVSNGKDALAIIFADFEDIHLQLQSNQVILNMKKVHSNKLRYAVNMFVIIVFEVIKSEQPQITYVIELVNQSSQALKQFQYYKLEYVFQPVYLMYKTEAMFQVCQQMKDNGVYEDNKRLGDNPPMLNCNSQFEQTYIIAGDYSGKQTRTEILYEYLRQICISRLYSINQWMQYRIYHVDFCLEESNNNSIFQCSKVVREQLKFNEQLIENCVNNSFRDGLNDLLEQQVVLSPEITEILSQSSGYIWINDLQIYGNYSVQLDNYLDPNVSVLFNVICESYLDKKPDICPQLFLQQEQRLNSLLLVIIVLCILLLIIICCYTRKRYLKLIQERNKLNDQIILIQCQQPKDHNLENPI